MRRTAHAALTRLSRNTVALNLLLALGYLSACDSEPPGDSQRLSFPLPEVGASQLLLEEGLEARSWDPGVAITARQRVGLLFLGGIDGGYIEPGDGAYSDLGRHYARYGVLSVFVKYRNPGELELCLRDSLQAAEWMRSRGVQKIIVIGWSFGGAVGIHATQALAEAIGFIGLAPQSLFSEPVARFRLNQSLFLIHSQDDENIPPWASEQILEEAPAALRKKLIPVSGYNHALQTAGPTLRLLLFPWIEGELGYQPRQAHGGSWMPLPMNHSPPN